MKAVREHLLFAPMTPSKLDMLVSGSLSVDKKTKKRTFLPYQAHLTCYAGGQFALGAKLFDMPDDIRIAGLLTEGCIWAYQASTTGIMPEDFFMAECASGVKSGCEWDEALWRQQTKKF